jgi:glutaminase
VGMEPTGDAFNSMVRLDQLTNNKPFNPMINAGAIAVASCIRGATLEERKNVCLDFARRMMDNPRLEIDYEVYHSEQTTCYKNRAIINLMKSNGIIDGEVEPHLDLYITLCSISVTCRDLAFFAATLANDGVNPRTGETAIPRRVVQLVRSLMVTCGMYDYSGEFAATVGVPAKSGVGGGILAAPVRRCGFAVYGPALDEKGNSVGGLKILEYLSEKMDLNMF